MKNTVVMSAFLTVVLGAATAADITVPTLELTTRGYLDDGSFVLATRGDVGILLGGGFKFGGRVLLGFECDDLENIALDRSLVFRGASVGLFDFLGLPIDLTYFTGYVDTIANGDVFSAYFGSPTVSTQFRGYLNFPDPAQVRYDGLHAVSGTGLKVTSGFGTEKNITNLYIYQDAYLGTGVYSLDVDTAFDFGLVKIEAFAGASYPVSTFGYYRGGVLLHVDSGQGGEFLAQVGIPRWDPAVDVFDIDLFFFLFEPRVRFGLFSIILTLFSHPRYYLQAPTNESGTVDINANFQVGRPETNPISGGVQARLALDAAAPDQLEAGVSPYLSAVVSGVEWHIKVNTRLYPFSLDDLFDIFVGVRASF